MSEAPLSLRGGSSPGRRSTPGNHESIYDIPLAFACLPFWLIAIAKYSFPIPSRGNRFAPSRYFTEMGSGSEAGSCLRLIDFCITQL